MHATRPIHETPKQRLQHVASFARPFRRQIFEPYYLIAIGLLAIMLAIIAAGIVGAEIFAAYIRRIAELSLPAGH